MRRSLLGRAGGGIAQPAIGCAPLPSDSGRQPGPAKRLRPDCPSALTHNGNGGLSLWN